MNKIKNLTIIISLLILTSCSQMFIDLSKSMEDFFGMVGSPSFSIDSGSFDQTQDLTIATDTKGAMVYYTDNGTEPTESNFTGSGYEKVNIKINRSASIKAVALKEDYYDSLKITKNYSFGVADPVFSLESGSFDETQDLTISVTTKDTVVYYTIDGTEPSDTNKAGSGVGSVSLKVNSTMTVKARSIKDGYTMSNIITKNYSFGVADPVFSIAEGNFDEVQNLTISSTTKDCIIYYTTDGSTPSATNKAGSGIKSVTFQLSSNLTIKAIAVKTAIPDSSVISKTFTLTVSEPVVSTLSGRNSITINTTTTGATIYYTTDGTAPSSTNNTGSGINSVNASLPDGDVTVKAIAVKNGYTDSQVVSQNFTVLKEQPQIEIKENSLEIVTGGNISFGTVNPNVTKDLTFTIKNNGWNSLSFSNSPKVTVSGAGFSLKTDIEASSIASLQNDTFVVSFSHSVMGTYTGTLTIANNSENAPGYSITLNASCYPTTPPVSGVTITQSGTDITMGTGVYNYGMVDIAGSGTAVQFSINNNSGSSLTLSATPKITISGSADFSVTTQPISPISNTISTIFGITFKPTVAGSKSATVLIEMNSFTDNPFVFSITGVGEEKIATPTFSLTEGTYETAQTTTITCATAGAVIRYTTDGTTPTKTVGTIYNSETINISDTMTLKAIAYKDGNYVDSDVASALYYIPPTFTMIDVPEGVFQIGGSSLVQLSAFKMSNTEVTYKLWKEVYDWAVVNGYDMYAGYIGSSNSGSEYQPVTNVNWYDVVKWCNAYTEYSNANLGTGYTCAYYTDTSFNTIYKTGQTDITKEMVRWDANGYRLPTESEWEYTARYQDGTNWTPTDYLSGATANYSNADACKEVAWYSENSGSSTHEVGTKRENQLNIFDMSGNVYEWCWDWYDGALPGGANPKGPDTGSSRLIRGGFFSANANYCQVGDRNYSDPNYRSNSLGFRIFRQ